MPKKVSITKEMILEAGFSLIREKGLEALNVRALAERIGCSTQPVLYNYPTMEALKQEIYKKADLYHSEYIAPKGEGHPLMELGINYVRFGKEEPRLFSFLFQTDHFKGESPGSLMEDESLLGILSMVACHSGLSDDQVKDLFFQMFITAHGLASLYANNSLVYDEEICKRALAKSFGMKK